MLHILAAHLLQHPERDLMAHGTGGVPPQDRVRLVAFGHASEPVVARFRCHKRLQSITDGDKSDLVVSVYPVCHEAPLRVLHKIGSKTIQRDNIYSKHDSNKKTQIYTSIYNQHVV